ncbi:MAG TPA: TspO/MBR family protein, partial [Candidatus Paceibacterota bacterium]
MSTMSRYVVAFIACYAAGFIGSLFIGPGVDLWYEQLAKPKLAPSIPVFVLIWIIMYGLMGIALGVIWSRTTLWHLWVGLFLVSLIFNASWIMFFFGFHAILLAFIDASVLMMMLVP